MPVMDEFKEERKAIKNAPFAKKLEYFKDYYLLKTLIILFAAGLLGAYLFRVLTAKETSLYVMLVNFSGTQETSEGLTAPFAKEHLNPKKQEVFIDSSSYISSDMNETDFIKYGYEDEQRLFAMVMTGEVDLFITGEDVIGRYAEQQWFDDLRTILPEDVFSVYEAQDRILYADDVPLAVKLNPSSVLFEYYAYNGRDDVGIYTGFPAGSLKRDLAVQFLEYLAD